MWQVFPTGPSFHPTPVHVQKKGTNELNKGDFLIEDDSINCPNQDFWVHENYGSPEIKALAKNERVVSAVKALS